MTDRRKEKSLREPLDDLSGAQLPPRFAEALAELRAVLNRCDQAGIPENTLVAAMMAVVMPRLVDVYGHTGAALALDQLSREISTTRQPRSAIQ